MAAPLVFRSSVVFKVAMSLTLWCLGSPVQFILAVPWDLKALWGFGASCSWPWGF